MKNLIMLSFLLVFLLGCLTSSEGRKAGYLQGRVSIGPLCPVESILPSPNCLPTQKTFDSWPIGLYDEGRKAEITRINVDGKGQFNLSVGQGDYLVDLENPQRIGRSNLPALVRINEGEATELNISIALNK